MNDLIDGKVSVAQCKKAVDALHQHQSKKLEAEGELELLPGKEQHIWLTVTTKKMQPVKKLMPITIPVVHPLVDPRSTAVCLIVKDPQREYKDLLEAQNIKFISRVVGITKLKGKFKPFEARRMLLAENGLFLADDRVVPLLPGLLGRKWFDAKKQPIPVTLSRKDLKGELERAISSTYMHQNKGTCTAIKISTMSQTSAQALENLEHALPVIATKISGGWENIQSLSIKTSSSSSLPIWNCGLDDATGGRWDGFTIEDNLEESEAEDDEMEVDGTPTPILTSATQKGKKRVADTEVDAPKKKAKAVPTAATPTPAPATASKVSKKRKSVAPTETTVEVAPVPATTAAEPSAKKRRKSAVPEADTVIVDEPTEVPAAATTESSTPKLSRNQTKRAARKSAGNAATGSMAINASTPKLGALATKPVVVEVTPVEASPKVKLNKKARARLSLAAAAAEPTPAVEAIVMDTPVEAVVPAVPEPSLKKKKSKKALTVEPKAVVVVETPAEIIVAAPEPSLKKKKSKKVLAEPEPVVVVVETPVEVVAAAPEPSLKKKKSKKALNESPSVTAAPGTPLPKGAPATPSKLSAASPSSLTKAEIATKRAGGGDKKKEKVAAKPKGWMQSAKEALLGKRAAQ